ncbi:MAG TPA: hypothetical protein VM010_05060, partial [Chitinophagaceae bacterium]|nr:hypothetical protein [Chitinophagaceae bacterium]
MKSILFFTLILCLCVPALAQFRIPPQYALLKTTVEQEPLYKLKPAVDIPLTAVSAGWTFYAFSKIYKKDDSSPQQIEQLDKNDLPG